MERAEPREILRPGLAQLDVVADNADDISLLRVVIREIAEVGQRAERTYSIVGHWAQSAKRKCARLCGEAVEDEGPWTRQTPPWSLTRANVTKARASRPANRLLS